MFDWGSVCVGIGIKLDSSFIHPLPLYLSLCISLSLLVGY
jgi:hypothetical protein